MTSQGLTVKGCIFYQTLIQVNIKSDLDLYVREDPILNNISDGGLHDLVMAIDSPGPSSLSLYLPC